MSEYVRVSYWLIPEPKQKVFLQHSIRKLASTYNGPVFIPHVTLCVGGYQSVEDILSLIKSIRCKKGISCKSNAISFSSSYTKSCFIEIIEEEDLLSIHQQISRNIPEGKRYEFLPHLSLFYGKLSRSQQQEISISTKIPMTLAFSQLIAIGTPIINDSAKDVERWIELGNVCINKDFKVNL